MSRQDLAAVFDAQGALEETLHEISPCAEDHDDESQSCPLPFVELIDGALVGEESDDEGSDDHDDTATDAPLPGLSR